MSTAPRRLGKYDLQGLLGRGGMAEVWKAFDTQLQRYVAIKLLHTNRQADPNFIARFTREAQMIAALSHPNIVQIYDFHISEGGEANTIAYMVMEYIQGGTLAHYIHTTSHQQHFPPAAEIIRLFTPISLALDYAHQQGMIHRDIKPANILLDQRHTARNSMGEPILSDFGLAKLLGAASQTVSGAVLGTPLYISPEQARNHPVSKQTDIYALGVVLYEIFTGVPPFRGENPTGVMVQHLIDMPTKPHLVNPNLPPALSEVLLKSLAKEPQDRFSSASAMTAAVAEAFNILVPEDLKQAISTRDVTNLLGEHTLTASPAPGLTPSPEETIASSSLSIERSASEPGKLTSQEEAPSQPERPWNVPFARNPFFTGRGTLLQRLHEQLSRTSSAALPQSYALSGLGGIGKTQTAIEYAYRYADEYTAVFWVRADSHEMLMADFVSMARLLGLPGQDAQDQMLIVAAVKRWLEQHEGWLLILDNADDLSLVADSLPMKGKGHILLTTRTQATGRIARSLSVEKMEPSEGLQLLLRRAKLLDPDEPLDNVSGTVRKDAQALISELDSLPLALDQAGAYIEETGSSISEYLALYQRRRLALLKRQSAISSDYPHTVASTWALSFQQVERENPAAADLLRLCAFVHPDAIPEDILTQGADWLGSVLQEVVTDPLQLNEAIQLLRRYSLLKRDPEAKLLHLHRLVQVVLKESLDQAVQRQWAERAVRAVDGAFPQVEFANWARCELYLSHAQVCAQLIDEYHFSFPEAAHLLHSAGRYLNDRGHYAQAEPLYQRTLDMRQQLVGLEHADTASMLNDLAKLYVLEGKYEQAEPLLQQTLAIRERVLGPEHREIAMTLKDLGWLYSSQGKYQQAEPLLQSALTIGERALGPVHPDLAEILNDLAALYYYQGKYEQAKQLFQRGISIYENALGPEHPDTLSMLSNLAALYRAQGKYKQAEPLLQRTLAIRERVLGPEHPELAISLFHLGQLYCFQGKYEQAKQLLQRAHAIDKRVLGPEHPYTTHELLYLAQLYQADSQVEQAESLYQEALTSFERVLGSEHPYVVETLTNLAQLYALQGNYEQAEQLLLRAVALEGVLGAEHPQIAKALDTLGHLSLLQGRDEQAERLLQRALSLREQSLGKSHPDVAQTLHHLAQLYQKQGKDEQAQSFYQRALTIREQALSPDHSDSVATREALNLIVFRDLL